MTVRTRFAAIGTDWEIETTEPLTIGLRDEVDDTIDRFDREWSRFRDDSAVAELARRGGSVPAPPDTVAMFDAYVRLTDATDGAIDPLVGAALEHLGYDADYSLRPRPEDAPRTPPWRAAVHWNHAELSVSAPVLIDVGAIGKGRLVDKVADVLCRVVEGPVVVDAGGDMVLRGAPSRVGLEHPYDPRRAIGVLELAEGAVAASAVNRRAWGSGLHHVLDARTGSPVRSVAATWAFADAAMVADGVATALFFDGGAAIAHAWGVPWVRMLTDGRVERSPGCPADLFTRREAPPVA